MHLGRGKATRLSSPGITQTILDTVQRGLDRGKVVVRGQNVHVDVTTAAHEEASADVGGVAAGSDPTTSAVALTSLLRSILDVEANAPITEAERRAVDDGDYSVHSKFTVGSGGETYFRVSDGFSVENHEHSEEIKVRGSWSLAVSQFVPLFNRCISPHANKSPLLASHHTRDPCACGGRGRNSVDGAKAVRDRVNQATTCYTCSIDVLRA